MKIILSLLILTAVLSASLSCGLDKQASSSLFGNLSPQLVDTLKLMGPKMQTKDIDPSKDNILIWDGGTRFIIAPNTFVDDKGDPYTDKVTFEVKENHSLADYITSHLQTAHGDELLQTQGMIYFTARGKNGETLGINKNRPIRIELPVNDITPDAKIFKGHRDQSGHMDWDTIIEPSKRLIPVPIRLLASRSVGECPAYFGITSDTAYYNKYKIYYTFDTVSKYENTLLATREFLSRYYYLCMPDLTNIYIAHLDSNMWEIDEMMVEYFIKDSTERVNFDIKHLPQTFNGEPIKQFQWDAHHSIIETDKKVGHNYIEAFKKFASQKLTKIDPSRKIPDSTIAATNSPFVSYDALGFGWVNVDYFYKDPQAEKIKLIAKTNKDAAIVNLILPGKKIILTGIPKGDNTYWFTKREDGYNKLPKGEKAIIFCMGLDGNKLFFADKEITIGEKEIETIDLMEANSAVIQARLKSYDTLTK